MKNNRYIAFDLSIFIYSNYHVTKKYVDKINPEKFSEKVIGQILKILQDLQKDYLISGWVLCADSNNFRKDFYDDYKAQREPNLEVEELKQEVIKYLKEDYDIIQLEGLEGDDLLYLYSKKYSPCIIVSNDNDCKLMLHENCDYYKYSSKTLHSLDSEILLNLKLEKIFLGDQKDNVPKILPKGKGRAYLNNFFKLGKLEDLKFSELLKEASKEFGVPLEAIHRNVILTNYSEKIYKKYVTDFDRKFEMI